jgi:hypothetical protein
MLANKPYGPVILVGISLVMAESATGQTTRTLVETREPAGGIPPALESDLLMPLLIQGMRDGFVIFDYGDHALKAFSYDGTLRWRFGRRGAGPREFANPTDLQRDDTGALWITDPQNLRLTVVRPDGSFDRELRLDGGVVRAVPTKRGFIAVTNHVSDMIVRYDTGGTIISSIRVPQAIADVPALAREPNIGPLASDGEAVIGFLYSDVLLYTAENTVRIVRGPVQSAFPEVLRWRRGAYFVTRVDPAASEVSGAISHAAGCVYVHLLASLRDVVDVFDAADGVYLYSLKLPEPADRAVVGPAGDVLVYTVNNPAPAVRVVRLPNSAVSPTRPNRQPREEACR